MTDLARELWRTVRRRTGDDSPVPGTRRATSRALAVQLSVPGTAGEQQSREVATRLEELVHRRATEVGLSLGVEVSVDRHGSATLPVAVSVAGRPLAVLAAGGDGESWVDAAVAGVDRCLRRRLSLLLPDETREGLVKGLVRRQGDSRPRLYGQVPGHVLDRGVSLDRLESLQPLPDLPLAWTAAEVAEHVLAATGPREVVLEVAEPILRAGDHDAAGSLAETRARHHAQTGLRLPRVRLRPLDGDGTVRIRVNDVTVVDRRLGAEAGWADVVALLDEVLREQVSWTVAADLVKEDRLRLTYAVPDLVRLSQRAHSDDLLTAVLRALVENGHSTRNLPRLLWLLLDAPVASRESDTVQLAESSAVRLGDPLPAEDRDVELIAAGIRRRAAEDYWDAAAFVSRPGLVALPAELEARIAPGVGDGPPDGAHPRADDEWALVRHVAALPRPVTIVVRKVAAIGPARYALQALPHVPTVVASQELPPDHPRPGPEA